MTPEEVCEQLGITPWLLERMRRDGRGPRCVRIGHRTVRYAVEDVRTWLESHKEAAR
ncbi:MAG TPA: helix-turn-helix domain-containing protein [Planctomycetota bacterium]|nr:helix-turn-helix domain-containing protein [Planctomycetota bacterium]